MVISARSGSWAARGSLMGECGGVSLARVVDPPEREVRLARGIEEPRHRTVIARERGEHLGDEGDDADGLIVEAEYGHDGGAGSDRVVP